MAGKKREWYSTTGTEKDWGWLGACVWGEGVWGDGVWGEGMWDEEGNDRDISSYFIYQ